MTGFYPDETIRQTAQWADWLSTDWRLEVPDRIHSSEIADDGAPQWHHEFAKWLTRSEARPPRNTEERLRTTKVMRRLRRVAVREYEVLYRTLLLGEPLEETTTWLNERAKRNNIPLPEGQAVHYRKKDTLALFIAGVDFCRQQY